MANKLRKPRQSSPHRSLIDHDFLMLQGLSSNIKAVIHEATGNILDIGCGRQPYRAWVQTTGKYIGLDIDRMNNILDVVSTSIVLPFDTASFDTVLCFEVLEHVPQPFSTFAEIARVLKPGGILLLTTPQSWRLHEAPYDFFRFTCFGLHHLAEYHGLVVESIVPHSGVWSNVAQTGLNAWPHHQLGRLLTPAIFLVNIIFIVLDRIWKDTRDPLGHLLVARKPAK